MTSCPLTTAQTSGDGCRCCLQPATPARMATLSAPYAERRNCVQHSLECGSFKTKGSGCLFHATRPNAGGTHTNVLLHAVYHRANPPQVRVPSPPSRVVCVADHISKLRRLAAHGALHGHGSTSAFFRKDKAFLSTSVYQTMSDRQNFPRIR